MKTALTLVLCASVAWAQTPDDAGSVDDAGTSLADELDVAANLSPTGTPAAPAPSSNPVVRAFQSLNPDLSVVLDATGGLAGAPSYSLSGDDPELRGGPAEHPAGFTVQEAEIGIQAVVDPYFRGDLFLTIPNLQGLEVEEGYVTSTSLPANLQVKAGIFRSALGRQNGQHLHGQDFTRRPLINEAYLGADGLRSPGLQVSWLFPTPFFLQLTGEAFSVGAPDDTAHLATFGGGRRVDLTYTAELKTFIPATDALSVYAGLDAATGVTPGVTDADGVLHRAGARTLLEGFDLYVKYKPLNVAGGFFSLAWTTELFVRQVLGPEVLDDLLVDGGLYSQLVAQVSRRVFLGLRQDFLGLPSSALQARVQRTSFSATFAFSEFARLRAHVERETTATEGLGFFSGPPVWGAYLQLEVSYGAHGAHPF